MYPRSHDERIDPDKAHGWTMKHGLHESRSNWTDIIKAGTPVSNIFERPTATASLYGNTTLRGSWIETEYSDVAAAFKKYGRIINNVTMAMPHPGRQCSHPLLFLSPPALTRHQEFTTQRPTP